MTSLLNIAEEHHTGVRTWTLRCSVSKRKAVPHSRPFFPPWGYIPGSPERDVDERTHHTTRHPTRRTTRRSHAMGGDASGARNRRAVLALNSAGRRSPSRHAARGRVARRGHPLYHWQQSE